jgi:hypothetical protein
MKKELPPLDIAMPEGYIIQRTPRIGGGIDYSILNDDPRYPLGMSEHFGGFSAFPSELNEEKLIVMQSHINPEVQRKGIARQIYKQAEKDTGKKIIPDMMLTEMSAPLHNKYGLGNEFGLSNYENVIRENLEKKAKAYNKEAAGTISREFDGISGSLVNKELPPLWPPEYSKQQYERIKRIMNSIGVDKFKSVAPTILKGIGPVAGAATAMFAPSVDAAVADIMGVEEMGISPEQTELDRKYKERIRQLSKRK